MSAQHTYWFTVWASTAAAAEAEARAEALRYFDPGPGGDVTLEFDAQAMHSVSGGVLAIEVRCKATKRR